MTTSELFRRDPQKGKKEFSTHHGFTIIELMIAIAVIAIIASLALPSYRAIIEKRQVTSGAEQAAAFFSTVKSQAVKRNHDIGMYPGVNGDDWCLGFKEFEKGQNYASQQCNCWEPYTSASACRVDLDNDGSYQANELTVLKSTELRKPETLKSIEFLSEGVPVSNRFFVFDSVRGFVEVAGTDYADSMNISFSSGQYALDVWIDRLGRTYTCSPDQAKAVPGYPSC